MDCYTTLYSKPSDTLYILELCIDENRYTLGYFDLLETALHSLDLYSKYKSEKCKKDDCIYIIRIKKNTLKYNETMMAKWKCLGPIINGISNGQIVLESGLRTNNIEI